MDITEIIKRAIVFPSKNLEILSIYAILSVLGGAFAVQGVITFLFGIIDLTNFVIGAIYIAIAIIIGIITRSISVQCVKSGIEIPIIGPPEMTFAGAPLYPPQNSITSLIDVPIGTRTFIGLFTPAPSTVRRFVVNGIPVFT